MSRKLERRLAFELTQQGRTSEVVELLASGISPNLISEEAFFDQSLLHEAVIREHADTALAIIACGGNRDYKDRGERSPFSYAASLGLWDVALPLLGAGVREDERNNEGRKPEELARAADHEALADFINQVSIVRYLGRQQKRPVHLLHLSLPQPDMGGIIPPAYPEPGRLGETLKRRTELRQRLDEVIVDERVRPIVESILWAGAANLKRQQPGPVGKDNVDLMGYVDQVLIGPSINGIRMTKRGWDAALPIVQATLDALFVEFDSSTSGLVCTLGLFKLERVAVDVSGREFRELDMTHTGDARCRPHFEDAEEINNQAIFEQRTYIQRRELVRVDGWEKCPHCGQYLRPERMRVRYHTVSISREAGRAFHSVLTGDKYGVLDAIIDGALPEERTIRRNTLMHLGCACTDRLGWCPHAEAVATAMACGTDPAATNDAGETGLHVSAFYGRYYPALMALAADVDPQAKDEHGFTAAEMAWVNGHEKFASLIENIGKARDLFNRCQVLGQSSMPEESAPTIDVKRKA